MPGLVDLWLQSLIEEAKRGVRFLAWYYQNIHLFLNLLIFSSITNFQTNICQLKGNIY